MASEDSQDLGWLPVVHRLRNLRDLDDAFHREVSTELHQLDDPSELLVVLPLRSSQWVLPEERNDSGPEVFEPIDVVSEESLAMVVPPTVSIDPADTEEPNQFLESITTRLPLDDIERRSYLPSESHLVTSIDGAAEAALSIRETHNPSRGREPFLLVFRTRRIVTAHVSTLERGTDMNEYRRDTRVFQHIAGCAPYRHRYGGQLPLPAKRIPTLGTLLPPTRSYGRAMSAGRSFLFCRPPHVAMRVGPYLHSIFECPACGL